MNNHRVLLVDDFDVTPRMINAILNEMGIMDTELANNGQEALAKLEEARTRGAPFSLVISDWFMPVMDGLELVKALRADPNYSTLPFIMVSSAGDTNEFLAAIEAGVSNYIIKYNLNDELKPKVQSALKI